MTKTIAVLGCFRSGTNFTKAVLELNFDCKVVNDVFGWKHGLVPIVSKSLHQAFQFQYDERYFVTKNPYSFLVSLYRYFDEVGLNIRASKGFDQFLRNPIVVFDQSQADSPKMKFRTPVEFWNFMNWHYASLHDIEHVRYEMLIQNPEAIATKLANKLGLTRKDVPFSVPKKKVKRMNDKTQYQDLNHYQTKEEFDAKSYLNDDYMKQYSQADKAFVFEALDHDLVKDLGYTDLVAELIQ